MSTSPLSPDELRAAAEVHRELGTEYGDAVLETFLAKIDKELDARIEARLAALSRSLLLGVAARVGLAAGMVPVRCRGKLRAGRARSHAGVVQWQNVSFPS